MGSPGEGFGTGNAYGQVQVLNGGPLGPIGVITSSIRVSRESRPATTTRVIRSLSEKIPTRRSPSSTGMAPTRPSVIEAAASWTEACGDVLIMFSR